MNRSLRLLNLKIEPPLSDYFLSNDSPLSIEKGCHSTVTPFFSAPCGNLEHFLYVWRKGIEP